ncbi:hypothetical protein BE11_02470 [Sorangium cellulosum]|nr:hypothetical protein BE11_02470 [Sorangium cellulosum]
MLPGLSPICNRSAGAFGAASAQLGGTHQAAGAGGRRPVWAATELFSSRMDDNFTIPVAVAAAVTIAGAG